MINQRERLSEIEREERKKVWAGAAEYWRKDATDILNLSRPKTIVAVVSPHGTGKSRLLIPNILAQGNRDGYNFQRGEFLGEESSEAVKAVLAELFPRGSEQRLLIIDEAGDFTNNIEGRDAAVSQASQDKINLILIAAAANSDYRKNLVSAWEKSANLNDSKIVVHEMLQKTLPENLIETYLNNINANKDLIEFYKNPENISLLTPYLFGFLEYNPPRTINDLRNQFIENNNYLHIAGTARAGLSKSNLKKLFKNLGIFDKLTNEQIARFEKTFDFN